jgi:2-oxo-4-hydroxy-4-carboxy-5-ureidoimidazoline decarboxylase
MTALMTIAVDVERFDEMAEADASGLLRSCADVGWWADELVSRRPFRQRNELLGTASDLMGLWNWADVVTALTAYSRLDIPADGVGDTLAAELRAVDEAYRQHFGRALLVRTTGRSTSEILRIGRRRLKLDEQADRAATTLEVRAIARRRLDELIG